MPKPKGTHWVITANYTDDGSPAYLTRAGEWSRSFDNALPIESDEEKERLLAVALSQELLVSDPYVFQVELSTSGLDPLSAKETIRARGPSTRLRRPDSPPGPASKSAR